MVKSKMVDEIDFDEFVTGISTEIVKGWQGGWGPVENDLRALLALQNKYKPKRCLEVGVNKGHAAALMLQECPWIEEYIGIDLIRIKNDTRRIVPEIAGEVALGDPRFKVITTPKGTNDIKDDEVKGPFDFIFLDAGHKYANVVFDTEFAEKRITDGGLLVWHDYGVGRGRRMNEPVFGTKQYVLHRHEKFKNLFVFRYPRETSSIAFQVQKELEIKGKK